MKNKTYTIQAKMGIIFLLLAIAMGLTHECTGQLITYKETQDIELASNTPNFSDILGYKSKDGSVFTIGDTLQIGRPSTNANVYTYIYFGKVTIGNAILTRPIQVSGSYQAEIVIIDRVYVSRGKKGSPLVINLFVKNPNMLTMGKINFRTIFDYEKAFMLGEVLNPRAPMTREEAIEKLKESKDLLDLGVITQSKYDSIKVKLLPLITN